MAWGASGNLIVAGALAAVAIALFAGLVRAGLVLGSDFTIRHHPRAGTTVRGRVPAAKAGEVVAFVERDLRPDGPITVRGSWGPGRSLRLSFSGRLSDGQKQRARNFLLDLLR